MRRFIMFVIAILYGRQIFSCYILMCIVFVCCCMYLRSSGCTGVLFGPPHLLAAEPRRPGVRASVSVLLYLFTLVAYGLGFIGLAGCATCAFADLCFEALRRWRSRAAGQCEL